jgi:drug/metabolite transporter (DMT)-like permease
MPIFELAALGAAACWAVTGLISAGPAQYLGAIAFTRTRMLMVLVMLSAFLLVTGRWDAIGEAAVPALLLSGFIGIFLGDSCLFLTLTRLGPRRTGILFAMNAPMSVVLGWIFLGEALSPRGLTGILLTIVGVVLAIAFGKRRSQLHHWESVKGPLWIGVAFGLTAALCQSIGSLIARPVMETGVDPVAASTTRLAVATLALVLVGFLPISGVRAKNPLTLRYAAIIAVSGFLAMGLGMTLLLFALSGGEVGIVSTLSATSPALVLPLLWATTKEVPAGGAWIGAFLVIAGTALIFVA